MKRAMRIGFAGSHGTGKSSVANRLINFPETMHFQVIDNAARGCKDHGYLINEGADKLGQLMILMSNIGMEKLAPRNYIATRTTLDPLVYAEELTERNSWDEFYIETYRRVALAHLYESYDAIFYFPITFELKSDGTRPMDPEYQRRIDGIFQRYLVNMSYFRVPAGSVEDRAEYVKNVIMRLDRGATVATVPGWTRPIDRKAV